MPTVATSSQDLLHNIDGLTLVATITIAVFGWIFALLLQKLNIRQEHKIEVRYDIFKQLVALHKQTQQAIGSFSAQTHAPFILMKSSMTPFELKLKKEFKGVWIPYSETECVLEGEKDWNKYVNTVSNDYFEYTKHSLNFLSVIEDWSAAFKPLLPAKKTLSDEISRLGQEIYQNVSKLQTYTASHGHDWRKWDEKEIEDITHQIRVKSYAASSYFSDFMTLLHNRLLSGFFWYKKPLRKTLDPTLKVLTERGLVKRVEENYQEKWQELQEKGVVPKDESLPTE